MTQRQPTGTAPELRLLTQLDAAWLSASTAERHARVLDAGAGLGETFRAGPTVQAVATLPLTTLVYPSRFAFQGAALSPAPFVTLTHRALLIEFQQHGSLKRLLFNPTDIEASRATPFFAKLIAQVGERGARLLATRFDPIEAQLRRLGLGVEHIDYLAFDHLHTQDLRGLLGTVSGAQRARFPKAKWLCPRAEWEGASRLHPMQRAWFVSGALSDLPPDRVVLTEGDVMLGDGVMLLRTPGHTVGNQTLFFKTDRGVWGCSENGTAADNWSPKASGILGVAGAARAGDLDVVLNANTPEFAADQYTSMCLERVLVDRVPHNGDFVQMFPSSEVTPSVLSPGLAPTLQHLRVQSGTPRSELRG